MKTKYVKLFEEYSQEQQFITDPVEIKEWIDSWKDERCDTYITKTKDIKRVPRLNGTYIIRPDGVVDVDGSVNVSLVGLNSSHLPIQFGIVTEDFYIASNSYLNSLKGCPIKVGGKFDCSNTKIVTLEYTPIEIGENFHKFHCTYLITDKHESTVLKNDEPSGNNDEDSLEVRYRIYSNYLSTLSVEDKANSISWLSRVDSELSSAFIQYAVDNNLTDVYSDRVVGINKNISTRQNKRMPLL